MARCGTNRRDWNISVGLSDVFECPGPNLIRNGGFESGDFTNWTIESSRGWSKVQPDPHGGSYAATLGTNNDGYLIQVVDTPATTCTLSFYLKGFQPRPTTAYFRAAFDQKDYRGEIVKEAELSSVANSYTLFAATFAGYGHPARLVFPFKLENYPHYWALDDVMICCEMLPSGAGPTSGPGAAPPQSEASGPLAKVEASSPNLPTEAPAPTAQGMDKSSSQAPAPLSESQAPSSPSEAPASSLDSKDQAMPSQAPAPTPSSMDQTTPSEAPVSNPDSKDQAVLSQAPAPSPSSKDQTAPSEAPASTADSKDQASPSQAPAPSPSSKDQTSPSAAPVSNPDSKDQAVLSQAPASPPDSQSQGKAPTLS